MKTKKETIEQIIVEAWQAYDERIIRFDSFQNTLAPILEKHLQEPFERVEALDKVSQAIIMGANFTYNLDPDAEAEETPDGLMPVGFTIWTSGCDGSRWDTGETLLEAINKSYAQNSVLTINPLS